MIGMAITAAVGGLIARSIREDDYCEAMTWAERADTNTIMIVITLLMCMKLTID
jgi:hypothetical protein